MNWRDLITLLQEGPRQEEGTRLPHVGVYP
jgi:hypothetical protein